MQKAYTVWKCKLTARGIERERVRRATKMNFGLLPAGLANQLYGVFSDRFNVNIHKNTLLICNGLRRQEIVEWGIYHLEGFIAGTFTFFLNIPNRACLLAVVRNVVSVLCCLGEIEISCNVHSIQMNHALLGTYT